MKVTVDLTIEEGMGLLAYLPLPPNLRLAISEAITNEQGRLEAINQLTRMMNSATSATERRCLAKAIELKGGPKCSVCRCGTSITPANGGFPIGECDDCYAKGYGK